MNYSLHDYVKVYRKFITEEVCDAAIVELDQIIFEPHKFYSHIEDTRTAQGNDPEYYLKGAASNKEVMQSTWNALNEYLVNDIRFPWFSNWGGFSSPKYLRYDVNATMRKHCDHIHDMFTDTRGVPVLSIIGVLNNEFTGGDLVLFDDTTYNLQKGDIIVFPSNFLFPHEVKPIESGKRYSFASFAW